ncbi:MAG: peptidylprolyl isomerase, partial [Armatimonadota bacterium]|nr:peptidylprolyl isomerase [Armatimonadota bacterium]
AMPGMPDEVVKALEHVKVPPPPAKPKAPDKARVRLETSKGPVTVELNGKAAPLHVKSFLHLAKMGYYDNTVFHRFEALSGNGQGRIIQGGDPLSKTSKLAQYFGSGGPGYQVPRERNELTHEAMVLAMARGPDPDSAGSQFYLTMDPVPHLDQGDGYTVFGKVVEGQANLLKLQKGDKLKKAVVVADKKSGQK